MFRNVKTEPRRFTFRSPHVDAKKRALDERLKQIEEALAREQGTLQDGGPPKINFSRRRRQSTRKQGQWATLRFVLILLALLYLLYRGILWAEKTDFNGLLKMFENG